MDILVFPFTCRGRAIWITPCIYTVTMKNGALEVKEPHLTAIFSNRHRVMADTAGVWQKNFFLIFSILPEAGLNLRHQLKILFTYNRLGKRYVNLHCQIELFQFLTTKSGIQISKNGFQAKICRRYIIERH